CGIFHGRQVYSRRSAATARWDFRNMTVKNVELLKLGLRIRASRKVLGWTQQRFSRNCGLKRSYFGGVERGKRNMTFSVLCQICDGLSCDIATVTKGIPHLQTVGGLASGSRDFLQDIDCYAFSKFDQSEQQVFSSHVVVVEPLGLLARKRQDP